MTNDSHSSASTPMPLPFTDDPDSAGFWEAAQRGVLAVRRCRTCGATLHAPTTFCVSCGGWDTEWQEVRGTATLWSWTVVEHATHPAFAVPYTAVIVELDGAPARLAGWLPGRPELRAGQPMQVRFETRSGVNLPQWEPA